MNKAPDLSPVKPASWPMLRAMVGVGLVCGVLIVATYHVTKPVIEHKQAEALQAAIFQVLPVVATSRTFEFEESGEFTAVAGPTPAGVPLVYAGYDEAGALVGLAVEGAGMGYQDVITVLWGYAPTEEKIVGLRVLESKETPGLGDKITSDEEFQNNFTALDVSLNTAVDGLANPVVSVKHGKKTEPWQIDGITGATISSIALARLLDNSAEVWLPRIRKNLDTFQRETER